MVRKRFILSVEGRELPPDYWPVRPLIGVKRAS